MPSNLASVIKRIDVTLTNNKNKTLIHSFVDFMKSTDISEKYQKDNLFVILLYARYLCSKNLSVVNTKEDIIDFLDTKRKNTNTDFNEMIDITLQLIVKYYMQFHNSCRIFVDGSNPSFIRALKARVPAEDYEYENAITHLKTSYGPNFGLPSLIDNMFVIPIAFNKEHKNMLAYAKKLMEYEGGVIHPSTN